MSTSVRKTDTVIISGKEMLSEKQRNEAKKPVKKDIMHGGPMPSLGCHQLQVCYYT